MSVGAENVELLGLLFYCSVNDKGISTDELSLHLKLPMDKILYTSSSSLMRTHTRTMMMHVGGNLFLCFTCLWQGWYQVAWRRRGHIFHNWWVSLQGNLIWLILFTKSTLFRCSKILIWLLVCCVNFSFNILCLLKLHPFGWSRVSVQKFVVSLSSVQFTLSLMHLEMGIIPDLQIILGLHPSHDPNKVMHQGSSLLKLVRKWVPAFKTSSHGGIVYVKQLKLWGIREQRYCPTHLIVMDHPLNKATVPPPKFQGK